MEKKFVFLILHYFTIEDTKACVESIFEFCDSKNYDIVIVDNGSTNGTGDMLKEYYEKSQNIYIIKSPKNLGFSSGNNLGFEFAKKELNADYIIMTNSDTLLIQNNFCKLIMEEYEKSAFALLGPRIILANNTINTYNDKPLDVNNVKGILKKVNLKKGFNTLYLIYVYRVFEELNNLLFSKIKKVLKMQKERDINTSIRKEDVVLQGCCLIFSEEYIKKFDGIPNDTFLYNEEQFLYWRIKENNLLSVFNPYIFIYHNESSSVKKTNKNFRKKMKFILENEQKSYKILLKKLKNMEE